MTANEIERSLERYRARLAALLTADEFATYDAYQGRVQQRVAAADPAPVDLTAAERAVVEKIDADTEAAALNRQFLALIGVEKLPQ